MLFLLKISPLCRDLSLNGHVVTGSLITNPRLTCHPEPHSSVCSLLSQTGGKKWGTIPLLTTPCWQEHHEVSEAGSFLLGRSQPGWRLYSNDGATLFFLLSARSRNLSGQKMPFNKWGFFLASNLHFSQLNMRVNC